MLGPALWGPALCWCPPLGALLLVVVLDRQGHFVTLTKSSASKAAPALRPARPAPRLYSFSRKGPTRRESMGPVGGHGFSRVVAGRWHSWPAIPMRQRFACLGCRAALPVPSLGGLPMPSLGKQQGTFPYESRTWHPVHCSDIEGPRRPVSRDGLNLGKLGMLASTQR